MSLFAFVSVYIGYSTLAPVLLQRWLYCGVRLDVNLRNVKCLITSESKIAPVSN
jgi:hypothetical protein